MSDTESEGGVEPCPLLLVEDDAGIGRMLERGLSAEGYVVDWCRDLASAIELARAGRHQVVVLDRKLPDGDGADFCAALRRFGHPAPVCMVTARETLEDKLRGFDAGADDYITKPFEFEELLARLGAMRRRASAQRPQFCVDAEARSLVCGTERVRLTRREWLLMQCFLENEGRLMSRADLIAEAWGTDDSVTENSAEVYVGYLRRKLGKIGDPLRIETVRGEGFRLVR